MAAYARCCRDRIREALIYVVRDFFEEKSFRQAARNVAMN